MNNYSNNQSKADIKQALPEIIATKKFALKKPL